MKIGKVYLLKYQLSDLKTYCAFNEDDILKFLLMELSIWNCQ